VGESPGIEEFDLLHPVTVRNFLEDETRLNVDVNYRTVNQIDCAEMRVTYPALFWNLMWHF